MSDREEYAVDLSNENRQIPSTELSRLYNAAQGPVYCEISSHNTEDRTGQAVCVMCSLIYNRTYGNFTETWTHRITTNKGPIATCSRCNVPLRHLRDISKCITCIRLVKGANERETREIAIRMQVAHSQGKFQ